jgi:hypothetical protein
MAIAFQGAAFIGEASNTTSLTEPYTVNAASNFLVIGVEGDRLGDFINTGGGGVAYAGVNMTFAGKTSGDPPQSAGNQRYVYVYYLLNPATGTNNFVITASGTCDVLLATAADYSGVGGYDTNNITAAASGTSLSSTITTANDNEWLIIFSRSASCNTATITGGVVRAFDTTFDDHLLGDSNGPESPAGSPYTLTVNNANASGYFTNIMIAVYPAATAPPVLVNKVKRNWLVRRGLG